MKQKSDNLRLRLLGFSPWILGSACILLLLVIAFFAVSNYEREKNLITSGLEQKGLTLVRFINSAVGDSVRSTMMQSAAYEKWETHMQSALELAVEQPGVEAITLVDKVGTVLLSVGEEPSSTGVVGEEFLLLIADLEKSAEPLWRTKIFQKNDKGESLAVIATRYIPPGPHVKAQDNQRGRMAGRGFRHSHHFQAFLDDMRRIEELSPVYLVQLDFSQFTEPLQRQFMQIVLELVAIFLVGLGGTLSFFTLRGLRGSEKRLGKMRVFNEVLVSSLPLGLIATDEHGAIQVINDAAQKMTGHGASDVEGRQTAACLPKVLLEMLAQNKKQAGLKRTQTECCEEVALGGFTVEATVVPVTATKEVAGGQVMLLRDVTQMKRLEVELQRSERLAAIGKMAAGVAHELRNPLSSIKGLTLLLKTKLGKKTDGKETADTLVREVERLNRSIGELLDYARPASLVLAPCSLATVVEKTLLLLEPDLASYDVGVKKDIEDKLPDVLVDKDKISQVLLNILLNSLQALEKVTGQRVLEIALKVAGGSVVLSVKDNGCGIAPENMEKIFDPYFTTKSGGTGLGLALSLKTVEEHSGRLLVSSTPGEGTRVLLYLPKT